MSLGDFRSHLRESVEILAVGKGDVKGRLFQAVTDKLLSANVPAIPELPDYFKVELKGIIDALKTEQCPLRGSVLATIQRMRLATAAKYAARIWSLYLAFEAFAETGELPSSP